MATREYISADSQLMITTYGDDEPLIEVDTTRFPHDIYAVLQAIRAIPGLTQEFATNHRVFNFTGNLSLRTVKEYVDAINMTVANLLTGTSEPIDGQADSHAFNVSVYRPIDMYGSFDFYVDSVERIIGDQPVNGIGELAAISHGSFFGAKIVDDTTVVAQCSSAVPNVHRLVLCQGLAHVDLESLAFEGRTITVKCRDNAPAFRLALIDLLCRCGWVCRSDGTRS